MSRRYRILNVSPQLLVSLFKVGSVFQGNGVIPYRIRLDANALPEDAEVVNAIMHLPTQDIALLVRSESYSEVAEGMPIPLVESPQVSLVTDNPVDDRAAVRVISLDVETLRTMLYDAERSTTGLTNMAIRADGTPIPVAFKSESR